MLQAVVEYTESSRGISSMHVFIFYHGLGKYHELPKYEFQI